MRARQLRARGRGAARLETANEADGQVYGVVSAVHGGCRVTVKCFDGVTREATIAGRLRLKRGEWERGNCCVSYGSVVVVSVLEYRVGKRVLAGVLHRLSPSAITELKKANQHFFTQWQLLLGESVGESRPSYADVETDASREADEDEAVEEEVVDEVLEEHV